MVGRPPGNIEAMTVATEGLGVAREMSQLPRIPWWRRLAGALRPFLEVFFCILLPLFGPAVIVAYLIGAYRPHPFTSYGIYMPDGGFLYDLHVMWQAGHDVVTGISPYPFVYPAPAALLMAPFGALPWSVAVVAFTLVLIVSLVLALRLLGVRDWRCYALTFASLPMTSSIVIGTLSPLLALGAAAAWRYRDKRWVVAAAIVGVVVTKIFLWPLAIWLLATRRFKSGVTTIVLGIGVLFGSWAVLGFEGLREYPHRLSTTAGLEQDKSYSPLAVFHVLGLPTDSARLLVLVITVAGLAAIVALARGKDGDRRSFVAAIGLALLASPIVWIHYLVLLAVPISLYRPRLSVAWLVPLCYWLLPGQENQGSVRNIVVMAALTTAAAALAIREPRDRTSVPALSSP
jgi:Glycosyltransferase family 87